MKECIAYPAVPAGSVETWVASRFDALEIPKSATFTVRESSSKILLGFTSDCVYNGWILYIPKTDKESSKILHHTPYTKSGLSVNYSTHYVLR